MVYHSVEVEFHVDRHGRRTPEQFVWKGSRFAVLSVGRSWQDESGEHVLVEASGGVYELLFDTEFQTWWLKPPAGPQVV